MVVENRLKQEEAFWDWAALDHAVDDKYISDMPTDECKKMVQPLKGNVLDLGCGVGRMMEDWYYGVDISTDMINIAKKRKPKCLFMKCDGRNIPYADSFFDSGYSVSMFQHIPISGVGEYLKEIKRVLRPGSLFTFQFVEGDDRGFYNFQHKKEDIIRLIHKYELELEKSDVGSVHHQWVWYKVTA